MDRWDLFILLPVAYMVFYVYALIFHIVPWLNIALINILELKIIQLVATCLFFTFGSFLFIVCLIIVVGILS